MVPKRHTLAPDMLHPLPLPVSRIDALGPAVASDAINANDAYIHTHTHTHLP